MEASINDTMMDGSENLYLCDKVIEILELRIICRDFEKLE